MKITFGNTILANGIDGNEMPIDFKIFEQRSIQITSTIRGEAVRAIDRGNCHTRIEFRIRKKHTSAEAAQNYILSHSSGLHDLETGLTIIGEPSGAIYHLNHAVISHIESTSNGNTSEHFYRITGGNITHSGGE
jgi:hypothetical protein